MFLELTVDIVSERMQRKTVKHVKVDKACFTLFDFSARGIFLTKVFVLLNHILYVKYLSYACWKILNLTEKYKAETNFIKMLVRWRRIKSIWEHELLNIVFTVSVRYCLRFLSFKLVLMMMYLVQTQVSLCFFRPS